MALCGMQGVNLKTDTIKILKIFHIIQALKTMIITITMS